MTDQDINELLKVFDNRCHCYPLNVVDAIRLLVKQRDEARREICEREARENWIVGECPDGVVINTPKREAQIRGWKCYDAEGAKP